MSGRRTLARCWLLLAYSTSSNLLVVIGDVSAMDAAVRMNVFGVIPILSEALILAVSRGDDDLLGTAESLVPICQTPLISYRSGSLDNILSIYITGAEICLHERAQWIETYKFFTLAQKFHLPILRRLRKTPSFLHPATRSRGIQIWTSFGNRLRLDNSYSHLLKRNVKGVIPLSKPCHWEKCVCQHLHAPHHMRVCKGCWRVLYCNTRCQSM